MNLAQDSLLSFASPLQPLSPYPHPRPPTLAELEQKKTRPPPLLRLPDRREGGVFFYRGGDLKIGKVSERPKFVHEEGFLPTPLQVNKQGHIDWRITANEYPNPTNRGLGRKRRQKSR